MDFTGGDVLSAGLGVVNSIYNMYTNKRDFDYQKALQQQIFEREDTAVQRRMNDLKAAGINPNLAAGSAASAGAVVGRSQTNDVNMGSALDMIQAANSIKQQKQAVKNAQQEYDILKAQASKQYNESLISDAEFLSAMGIPYNVFVGNNGKEFSFKVSPKEKGLLKYDGGNTPFQNLFNFNIQNQKNSADLLQKDVDWYTADKISGMALGALGLGNSFKSWKSLFSK